MKHITKRLGQITIPVLLTVIGGVAIGVFTGVTYVYSVTGPIEGQVQANQTAIASMQSDIAWIKLSLQARGFSPTIKQSSSTL